MLDFLDASINQNVDAVARKASLGDMSIGICSSLLEGYRTSAYLDSASS